MFMSNTGNTETCFENYKCSIDNRTVQFIKIMILPTNPNQKFIRRVLMTVAIIIAALLFVLLVYYAIDIILLLFAAVLIAIFLRGLGDLTRRYTKLSEGLSVVLVSFLLLVILGGAIALLARASANKSNICAKNCRNPRRTSANIFPNLAGAKRLSRSFRASTK